MCIGQPTLVYNRNNNNNNKSFTQNENKLIYGRQLHPFPYVS